MLDFLLKKCVRQTDNRADYRKRVGVFTGIFNIICNLILFVAKLFVGILSASVAVTADAFNNLSDCGASLVTLVGFSLAAKAPDKKHPFGYGRAEYIAGAVISVLILLVGVEFVSSSVGQIFSPQTIDFSLPMAIVLVAAIAVKLFMWYANTHFGKALGGSATLSATAFDSLADVATTTVALLSLILSRFTSLPIDGYLGVVIAIVVVVGGFKVLLDTINPLLGQPPDREMVAQLRALALSYPEIVGIHDIMVHNYGPSRTIASLHAEVPANHDIIYAHEVIDRAEREIAQKLNITVIIHLDPLVTDDKRVNEVREEVNECLREIHPHYSMHDFRMLDGKQQINLLFDVLLPFGLEKEDEEILNEINQKLHEKDPRYYPIITLDRSFIG